ncbi:signal peptidase I [Candidatus Woesearchaeota archaeon]|nr:signal peptidase I [Candidatus Woesearchaeota archaeon]
MDWKTAKSWLGRFWHFIWEEDSIGSWIANIAISFILVKFLVYPGLGFILNTPYPIVAVVSGSMEHKMAVDNLGSLRLCGNTFAEKAPVDFSLFWKSCGSWYGTANITQSSFQDFPFASGFNRGDIMILYGKKAENIDVGDVIVFRSKRPDPIIHRVVKVINSKDGKAIFQTKGDHNAGMIQSSSLDESSIPYDKVIGNAVVRVPLLGYVKIWFVELLNLFKGTMTG